MIDHPVILGVRFEDVDGFPGYCIGDHGKVFTNKLKGSQGRSVGPWREVKATVIDTGYLQVDLSHLGSRKKFAVHRLVLEAFVGPCPEGMECLHGDGDRANDDLSNLKWGTPVENQRDRVRHGTDIRGSSVKLRETSQDQ